MMEVTKRKPNTSPLSSDNPELLLRMFRDVSVELFAAVSLAVIMREHPSEADMAETRRFVWDG